MFFKNLIIEYLIQRRPYYSKRICGVFYLRICKSVKPLIKIIFLEN
ncbi:Conserved hypothetical protein [Clostridium neonatale]|nr:Conserved hypothetical protein [Clostridium neonatale]CAI3197458.1 Conserved hypothetical protein [Clostridium neonatale]CAI3203257.1 Conserved hypothetical protein [Clostridium neonatale]CAI3221916.1 Conserved hypothetical protein [Clostridium neonatale]CAI3242940.1 Conserved hypothetical protein [Clostridium neonatale]